MNNNDEVTVTLEDAYFGAIQTIIKLEADLERLRAAAHRHVEICTATVEGLLEETS